MGGRAEKRRGRHDRNHPRGCEDEPLIQLITSEALNESGYRVLVAADSDEAIGILSRDDSGAAAVHRHRDAGRARRAFGLAEWAKSRRPDLKVLYTSGYSWAAAQVHGGRIHGHMLRKPYRSGELQRAVRDALSEQAEASQDLD
ncbi:MAG: hypothetical protein WDO24_22395 [Pseudomonadota bacterium]